MLNIQSNFNELVDFEIEGHLRKLIEEIRNIRSEAQLQGQYGGSRMVLAIVSACQVAFENAAEITYKQLEISLRVITISNNKLHRNAKDMYFSKLSDIMLEINKLKNRYCGSNAQCVLSEKLNINYSIKISNLCSEIVKLRRRNKFDIFTKIIGLLKKIF